jgi:hypothetical protein
MFVPCDEYGNVLKEPNNYVTWLDCTNQREVHWISKSMKNTKIKRTRVLFEGLN